MRKHFDSAAISRLTVLFALVGCGPSENEVDTGFDTSVDASPSDAVSADSGDAADADSDPITDAEADSADITDALDASDADAASGAAESPQLRPYVVSPAESLLPDRLESCAVIAEERCDDDTVWHCSLFDGELDDWAGEVPAMTEQAFWFDRYFDLYQSPSGLSMDLEFMQPALVGTPEEEWSSAEFFRQYDGRGDSSGWTGTALWGAAARYAVTGTAADYERMIASMEALALLYEVTSVPGMLARSHYAMLEDGAPEPHGRPGELLFDFGVGDGTDGHFTLPIDETLFPRFPDYYFDGVEIGGTHYGTSPRFQYDTSRDQYVRGLPGLMLAYDLLGEGEQEDALRVVLEEELPCTLNRLRKGRISNLQSATAVLDAVTTYLGAADLLLDEGDLDFTTLDELVFYVMEQPHPDHLDAFDASCPDGPPMEVDPDLEFDASEPTFLTDFVSFAQRENRQRA